MSNCNLYRFPKRTLARIPHRNVANHIVLFLSFREMFKMFNQPIFNRSILRQYEKNAVENVRTIARTGEMLDIIVAHVFYRTDALPLA